MPPNPAEVPKAIGPTFGIIKAKTPQNNPLDFFPTIPFEISTFFGLKNLIFDLHHLTAHSHKNIPHRGLFLVSMESQRSKYLSETKFRVVGGHLAHL